MNKLIRSLIVLAASTAGATALLAQPALKLITVDMARAYDNYYKTEEGNAKFREAEQKANEQVEELNKQGQTLVDEYKELVEQSKSAMLTPEARTKAEADSQKKLEDIQRKQNDVQNFRVNTQRSLQQRMKVQRDLLLEEITKVVNDLAKARGATLVIDKAGPTLFGISSVLYSDPAYDITDEVLAAINRDRPPAAAAAAPSPAATPFTVPNVGGQPAKSEPKKP
ncbi:MAG: OmpH family outer membrane protein [Opitutaceae bacterium]|nr:OmpH family outer membrane protein [Opitutaceae bacterium]